MGAQSLWRDALQGGSASSRDDIHAGREVGEKCPIADAEVAGDREHLCRRRGLGRPSARGEGTAQPHDWHQYETRKGVGEEFLGVFPRILLGVLAQLIDRRAVAEDVMAELVRAV